jgi:hypothetical protein
MQTDVSEISEHTRASATRIRTPSRRQTKPG